MPIYEYQCQNCGHQLEALQKISDPPLQDCPSCESPALQKLVSAASFRLKGGGWYETDFKSGDKKHLADSDAGEKAGNKAESNGKTGQATDGKNQDKEKKSSAAKTNSPGKEKSAGGNAPAAGN